VIQTAPICPSADGESRIPEVTSDQFSDILNHIEERPTRANRNPSPSIDDTHNASRAQYVVLLAGISEVELIDGTMKCLYPGDVLIAQDLIGHGHITRGIGEEFRVSLTVPIGKV